MINDKGNVSVLEDNGLIMPELKCRLLRPQDHFIELQILEKLEGSFPVTWDNSVLNLSYHVIITINYEQTTHILMLHDYKSI